MDTITSEPLNGASPALHCVMREKFFHSRGAALYREGLFDEAIRCLRQAVLLDDRSYNRHYLGLACWGKGDVDGGIHEMGRAILQAPSVAEYYFVRSRMWRDKGNHARAFEDYAGSIVLDGHYRYIEQIRTGMAAVQDMFSGAEPGWATGGSSIQDRELAEIAGRLGQTRKEVRSALEDTSCPLPCPAYCCHFDNDTLVHGITLGPWKLQAIRRFLRDNGLAETDFLDRMAVTGEEYLVNLVPPQHVIRDGDRKYVYFPKRGGKRLERGHLDAVPKGRDYTDLLWTGAQARSCAFLTERGCMIYHAGDEPGLPACREFLCFTGLVFSLFSHLGLVEEPLVRKLDMMSLNDLAVEGVLVLAGSLCTQKDVHALQTFMDRTVAAAIDIDRGLIPGDLRQSITQYREAERQYEELWHRGLDAARARIRSYVTSALNDLMTGNEQSTP
jgi:tetratricopeptide (TPR) repeat protein